MLKELTLYPKVKFNEIFSLSTTYPKKSQHSHINSNKVKLYTKIVYLDEIYNYAAQTLSIRIHFDAQTINPMFMFKI
jgi:hypothetical protein